MSDKEAAGASIAQRIRKRRILQIALVYVGAAWLGVEITDFIVGNYGFSRKILDTVVFLAILGFPAFLVIGWFHGERGPQRVRRAEAWLLVTLASLGAIGTYRIATAEPAEGPGVAIDAHASTPDGAADGEGAPILAGVVPDLGRRSLAVLPFRNNVADAALEWLGAGVADLLTTNLAQLPGLSVVGRQSLYDLLLEGGVTEEEDIPEALAMTVARGSGARMLLWGSVTGAAEDMRIDAQLIEVENGTIASAVFVRGDDVFALVDSLSVRLGEELTEGRAPGRVVRLSHLGTSDLEALAAFHRGNSLARAGRLGEAEAHYERAAELDSAFALPFLTARVELGEPGSTRRLVQPGGDPAEPEHRPSDWRERRSAQIARRLPEDVRQHLAGLRGEELRAAIDSLLDGARSGVRLLVTGGQAEGGEVPDEPPPGQPPPRDPPP